MSKKQRRHLGVVQNSLSPELETVTSTLAVHPDGVDLSRVALPLSNPFDPTEDMYKEMLLSHKRKQRKIEQVCYSRHRWYVISNLYALFCFIFQGTRKNEI